MMRGKHVRTRRTWGLLRVINEIEIEADRGWQNAGICRAHLHWKRNWPRPQDLLPNILFRMHNMATQTFSSAPIEQRCRRYYLSRLAAMEVIRRAVAAKRPLTYAVASDACDVIRSIRAAT